MSNTTRKLIKEIPIFEKHGPHTKTTYKKCGSYIEMVEQMFEEIKNNLNHRMSVYTDSRQPTGDEVRLAWLVGEIEYLNRRLKKTKIKALVSVNSYPSNYVEEKMPQIVVEIRYRKDYDLNNEYRKEEALTLATKMEILIDEIL